MNLRSTLALVLICCASGMADDAALKKGAKARTQELSDATVKGSFEKILDLTHPRVIELGGGRDKMIAAMEVTFRQMKEEGIGYRSAIVEEPSDPVRHGTEVYIVVPFRLEMKAPGGKVRADGYVVGVTADEGKTWGLVNGIADFAKLKQILPDLPDRLMLPAYRKPTFERD